MRLVYVVTCGQCGQTWQRSGVTEGETMECIFCGQRGRLCIGAMPDAAPIASRVEAWLLR